MERAAVVLLAAVLGVLVAAACEPESALTIQEPSKPWRSFTGAAVPSDAPIYVSGIHVAGGSVWLAESWITRGHSHTGLFESVDNGATWIQMLGWDGWAFYQKYFDSTNAVVLAWFEEGYGLHPRLLSTHDSGRHWTAADLPVTPSYGFSGQSIYFVDPNNGWLMKNLGGQFGRCTQAKQGVAVYQTHDGGASWTEVIRVDERHPEVRGLSLLGGKVGLSFRSATDGYLTTADPINGNIVFFTHDGGASWKQQNLPIDAGRGNAWISPPEWITAKAGLMSVKISPQTTGPCFIGRQSPSPPQRSPSPAPWDVEAPAGIVVHYPGELLLATDDGGNVWTNPAASSSWGSVTDIAATDEMHWSVAATSSLWQTSDSGHTWLVRRSVLKPGCRFGLIRFVNSASGWASALCSDPGPVIQGCPGHADYASQWDCPPLALPLLSTRDGGSTWIETAKPVLR